MPLDGFETGIRHWASRRVMAGEEGAIDGSSAGRARVSVAAIIVAAGRGTRLGGVVPKQYVPIGRASALRRSVEAFLALREIAAVLTVIHADDRSHYDAAIEGIVDHRLLEPVQGCETRALSVRAGLEALENDPPETVLIHDAARPFVPEAVIRAVIEAIDNADGAAAALPVVDALWKAAETGDAIEPVPRERLWRAQTPQGFRYDKILAAHRAHDGTGADDVAVAREAGLSVRLVKGSETAYKITTAADLERALADVRRNEGSF